MNLTTCMIASTFNMCTLVLLFLLRMASFKHLYLWYCNHLLLLDVGKHLINLFFLWKWYIYLKLFYIICQHLYTIQKKRVLLMIGPLYEETSSNAYIYVVNNRWAWGKHTYVTLHNNGCPMSHYPCTEMSLMHTGPSFYKLSDL